VETFKHNPSAGTRRTVVDGSPTSIGGAAIARDPASELGLRHPVEDKRTATGSPPDSASAGGRRDARVLSADTLQGELVVNGAQEELGEIEDIMIDVTNGRVAYAVLSVGGFLGIGDRLFPVPWAALRLDPAKKRFILDISKERLKRAPGFDKDRWPAMADEQWAGEVHSYYGKNPYWL
jgi:sporulation protein YlmC with PRC-barrel domain